MNENRDPHSGNFYQPQASSPLSSFFNSLRSMGFVRAEPRVLGGVLSGINRRWGWDLTLIRVVFVILAFFFPLAVAAYGLVWFTMPEARDGRIHAQEMVSGRLDVAQFGALALLLLGLSQGFIMPSFVFNLTTANGFSTFLFLLFILFALIAIGLLIAFAAYTSVKNSSRPQAETGFDPAAHAPASASTSFQGVAMPSPSDFNPPSSAPDEASAVTPDLAAQPSGVSSFVDAADTDSANAAPVNADVPDQEGVCPTPASAESSFSAFGPFSPAEGHRPPSGSYPPPPAGASYPYAPASIPQPSWGPLPRPRTLPAWVNLLAFGLLTLVLAAVLWTLNYSAMDAGQAARYILYGGGVCLLIVAVPLAVAAMQDRSAHLLLALSIMGMLFAIPVTLVASTVVHDHEVGSLINHDDQSRHHEYSLYGTEDKELGSITDGEWDLTSLPAGDKDTYRADSVLGDFTILVRKDQPIAIELNNVIGSVSAEYVDPDENWVNESIGIRTEAQFRSVPGSEPVTVVRISNVVGNLIIREVDVPEPSGSVSDTLMSTDRAQSAESNQSKDAAQSEQAAHTAQSGTTR